MEKVVFKYKNKVRILIFHYEVYKSKLPKPSINNLYFPQINYKLRFHIFIHMNNFKTIDFDKLCVLWWNPTKKIMIKSCARRI